MDTVNVKPLHYAIIKPRVEGRNYGQPPNELTFVPDTAPLQDSPSGTGKGATLTIRENVWRYIEKINPLKADYGYVRKPHAMWINIEYEEDTLYSAARAESISCGCNIVAYTEETNTHIKLLARPTDFDFSNLNPAVDNWYYRPYMYFKAQAIRKDWRFAKVANAQDVYIPLLYNPGSELWIEKSMIELFPAGYNYRFYGINIYDGDRPLRVNGANYNGFPLSTPSLIPPHIW
jgi:hypothetical protein